jgi:hypothetical protein
MFENIFYFYFLWLPHSRKGGGEIIVVLRENSLYIFFKNYSTSKVEQSESSFVIFFHI